MTRQARRTEALVSELEGLRGDETRLLDRFVRSGAETMTVPLSDYAADSLYSKSLIETAGGLSRGEDQTYSIPHAVRAAWEKSLARRA